MIGHKELYALASERGRCCVSLLLPTHEAGAETRQDPIRFGNLIRTVARRLGDQGMRPPAAEELLRPASRLLEEPLFWQHQSRGLAVFLSNGAMRSYRVPLDLPELAVVGNRFHVKPLLPLFGGDGRFYVLAISQNRIRLLEASRDAVRDVDLKDIPASLSDVVGYDWEQKSLQFHTGTPKQGGGMRPAIFHGHGAGKDDTKKEVAKFFRVVDRSLHELLEDRRAPLVLAAVDYLVPIYRSVSDHPRILEECIPGNPEELSAEELHRRAWELVQPIVLEGRNAAAAHYGELAATDSALATNDLEEAVLAAIDGRIETLFVARGVQHWGRVDPSAREVEIHDERGSEDEDLTDFAAVEALLRDGTVYVSDEAEVPDAGPVAAVLRY